jgi:AraC family transcriptional activator of pobA
MPGTASGSKDIVQNKGIFAMSIRHQSKNLPVHSLDSVSKGESGFNISQFDQMGASSHSPFPHRHAFYEIMYIEGGKGTHIIDFEPYSVAPDSLFYFSPGQTHFWRLTSPLEGRTIRFTENFLLFSPSEQFLHSDLDLLYNVSFPPYIKLGKSRGEKIKLLFNQIEKEYRSNDHGRELNIRSYLVILLIEIQRLFIADNHRKTMMKSSVLINMFKKMVSNESLPKRPVVYYAGKLGVSEAYLHEVSKQNTGLTPGQIIRKEIALEAKRQLAHTDSTVAEIGYRLHFDDPSYFGRFFKRETGRSPKTFRSYIRKKYQIL